MSTNNYIERAAFILATNKIEEGSETFLASDARGIFWTTDRRDAKRFITEGRAKDFAEGLLRVGEYNVLTLKVWK
jgi:hypothetical protein